MSDSWHEKQKLFAQWWHRSERSSRREHAIWRLDTACMLAAIERFVAASGGLILDVGSGHLDFAAALPPGSRYIALDPLLAPTARQGVHGGALVRGLAEALPFADAAAAAVLFRDSLDHIADDRAALREAARVLVPGGAVLVAVSNRGSLLNRVRRVRDRLRGRPGYQHLSQHLRHYDLADLRALAARSGFELVWARSHAYAAIGIVGPRPLVSAVDRLTRVADRWCALWLPDRGDKLIAVLRATA